MWQHCPGGELLRQPPPWADARLVASKRAASAAVIGFIVPLPRQPAPNHGLIGGATSTDQWYMSRREGLAMTDEDARLLRLALLSLEETMNEVISDYFEERSLTDGGEELIALVAQAVQDRYDQLMAGEADTRLATWKHRSSINRATTVCQCGASRRCGHPGIHDCTTVVRLGRGSCLRERQCEMLL